MQAGFFYDNSKLVFSLIYPVAGPENNPGNNIPAFTQ